jgi:hypothetical protein
MSATSATARQCMDLAAAAAPAMVGRAIDRAITSLQEEEQRAQSVPRRQELADAWLELSRRRQDWGQRYPSLLRAAMAVQQPAVAEPVQESNDRFGGLSLVDETQVARAVESSRVLQLLAPRLEQPLAELDTLMSTALGLATVTPERNPLRPQVFANALRELMQPAPQAQWPGLWSRHLAAPLASEIETLYRSALKVLQDAKLEAASYRVLPPASPAVTPAPAPASLGGPGGNSSGGKGSSHAAGAAGSPSPLGRPAATPSAAGPALGGSAWADLSHFALGDELFQHFLFARTPPSAQELAPAYYARVEAQTAAIDAAPGQFAPYDAQAVQRTRALPPVERPHRPVSTSSALDEQAWGQWAAPQQRARVRSELRKEARQVGQVLGLEVVRKVVDQVGCDPRLLAPVREAVVGLEPALSRLALVAPRFFGQEDHAGRRLVERVAERSFRYNDEFSSEFQEFFAGVRSAFHGLNDHGVESDAPFGAALGQLEQRWASEDAIEEPGRQVAVSAVHFAEAREAEAAQIAWTLSQRADLDGVPAVVQDFLYGPWSLVMAHARLTDPGRGVDPGGWAALIPDLLWSVKRDQILREPARLITTIPGMLERLRTGIATIGQDACEHESLFAALEKLHRPVLELRAKKRSGSKPLDPEPQLDAALLSTERQQPRARAGALWMTPAEQQAAGFDAEAASAAAPLQETAASKPAPLQPGAGAAPAPQAVDATDADATPAVALDALRAGCWVDLFANGRWRRANLTWVSSRATLFMFVSHGGRPHSMTRRSLERLLRERLLRPVESGAVVARAMDALTRQGPGEATRVAPSRPQRLSIEEHAAA